MLDGLDLGIIRLGLSCQSYPCQWDLSGEEEVGSDCGSPSSFSSLGFTGRQMSPQGTDCTLETGLQAPLVLQQDPCSVGSMERWQNSPTRLEAHTGGAGRVAQAFCSVLPRGVGGITWRMREQEAVLRGPPG